MSFLCLLCELEKNLSTKVELLTIMISKKNARKLHDVTYLLGHLADHCEADGCDDGLIDDLTAAKKFKEKLAQDDYNHVQ